MPRKRWLVLPVLAVVLAAGAYIALTRTAPTAQPANIHQTANTRSYSLLLAVAPAQPMYSFQEVAARHPAAGEEMLGGTMVMPGSDGHHMEGMDMSDMAGADPSWRHVEVHVYSRGTDTPIRDAHPAIAVRNDAGGKATDLPIATMQSVAIGPSDYHYGNNTYMPGGQDYTITVRIAGESATFHVHV
jgi:hypothetical protein